MCESPSPRVADPVRELPRPRRATLVEFKVRFLQQHNLLASGTQELLADAWERMTFGGVQIERLSNGIFIAAIGYECMTFLTRWPL